jgi:hypothetical protein
MAERLHGIRERAHGDPVGARDEAWSLIEELSHQAGRDWAATVRELQEVFRCGRRPETADGETEGIFVAWTVHPLVHAALSAVGRAWMPWRGKTFWACERRGANILASGRTAIPFRTYFAPGRLEPDREVLVIDYAAVRSNPRPVRQVRDELVEIVAGSYLGQMLVRVPGRREPVRGCYFALRSEPPPTG